MPFTVIVPRSALAYIVSVVIVEKSLLVFYILLLFYPGIHKIHYFIPKLSFSAIVHTIMVTIFPFRNAADYGTRYFSTEIVSKAATTETFGRIPNSGLLWSLLALWAAIIRVKTLQRPTAHNDIKFTRRIKRKLENNLDNDNKSFKGLVRGG